MATISTWVKEETMQANFGDKRLNKRFGNLLDILASQPQETIPGACKSWKETLAAYRFFDNEDVNPEKILSPHRETTLERIRNEPVVLIVQEYNGN